METRREEAAPTFPTWRRRLQEAGREKRQEEIERFLQVLRAVGTPMIDGPAVHFVYYGPEARQVALAGEFNQWNRRGTAMTRLEGMGIFYHTMEYREPARVEYKLIVDGQWIVDPFCPNTVDNGIGEQNSYFVVGSFHEPPELAWVPTIPHGRVEEFDFESEILHNRRRVYVYLPPGYDEETTKRFSTLYVHDGGEYLTRARLSTILDNLLHSQDIPPLIAVMVDPVDRIREYWANEDYARFMEQELIPHIDGRYRTLAQREARGVMGASMGGLISTYLALSRPHLFSKVGGQSSALFLMAGDRTSTQALVTEFRSKFALSLDRRIEPKRLSALVSDLRAPIAFYFDVGKYEPQFIPAHRQLVPLLEAQGCPCFFQELTGGHNWTSWQAHLKDLLTFLWRESTTARSNSHEKVDQQETTPSLQPTREDKMTEILSAQEIQTRYDGEWVLIGDPEVDASLTVQRGRVLWHSKDRDEVYRQARLLKPKHSAFLFMGRLPKDMAVVL
ncbi:MAG: alpha/beta hydrolase-fold protein [Candidatus Binatia bacterium]